MLHLNTCYFHEIEKCVFKRLTFSTNVASEGLVTFMKLENVFSQTNIFHKCHTCKTYHFHEIGKYVFKRLTFSTNVTSERLVTFMTLENMSLKG